MMNYNYKLNYLNGKALSQHSISSLSNKNINPACIHLHAINNENNFKTNRSISYNLNNSNLSLNQQKLLLGNPHSYYHNPLITQQQTQALNSKSVVNRTNSFRNGHDTAVDNFIFSCNPLTNNKFTDLSLHKLNKKILSIDKYIKNNRSESSSTISLLSDLEFEIKEDLTVNENDHKPVDCSAINKSTSNIPTKTDTNKKEINKLPLSDSKSKSSIFNYRPVIEDSLETLINEAKKNKKILDKENYDNHNYSYNKYRTSADLETIAPYSKDKYKITRNKNAASDLQTSSRYSANESLNITKLGLAKSRANSKSSTSSYYNRVESSSSVESLNKNSSGSSKNLFKKNLSLYYDSGIGVDSPLANNFYSKYLRLNKFKRVNTDLGVNKSSHDMNSQPKTKSTMIKCNKSDYNLRKESSSSSSSGPKQLTQLKTYCKTLNPSMGRRYYNESNAFNLLNSSSSQSVTVEKKKDIKSHKQLYSTSDINGKNNTVRMTMRSSSPNNFKNFFCSSLSMQAKTNDDDEEDNAFIRKSSLTMNENYNKADFTPQLLTNSGIIKTNSIKQKTMHKPNKLQAKNDVTIKSVTTEELKSSPNMQQNTSSKNITSEFQKHCISTISKNLNNLTNDLNGRKLKIEVEVKRTNPKNKQVNNDEIDSNEKNDKKVSNLNDYSTLYSKNINLKKSEKNTLLNDDNELWHSIKNKYGTNLNDKSKMPDKSHIDKKWFHGNLTRNQAYLVIMENQSGNGSFLVRNNSSEEGSFTLCIYKSGKIYNYKINSENEHLFITNKHKFTSLNDLIEFYKKNSAGLICELKTPIAEENLIEKSSTVSLTQNSNLKKYKIERRDIEFFEKIGSGQFGVVLKAEYKKRKTVAVKKMKPGSKDDEINFNREAEFMMKLQNLQEIQHRNLVQFFGISKDFDDSILIVTEFVKYGSLYNYLLKYKERIVNSKSRLARLLNICIDVCDGMEYLESNRIIHRDLACRNCLVGEGEVIKVADFGLARFTDDYYIAHPQSQFPVKWSAPEVIKYRSYSSKSDVWSFSCLMYEVFTCGKMPYGGNTTNSIAAKQIISGIIPEKPVYCPLSLYDNALIKAWSKEPKDRPSFKELMQLLNDFNN